MALRDAGIAEFNLVRVSSIFPPNCQVVSKEDGLKLLQAGEVVFVVLAEMSTNEPGRRHAASVGMARPSDPNKYGYLSEHHTYGQTEQEAADYAEDLAATMLSTTLSIPYPIGCHHRRPVDLCLRAGRLTFSRFLHVVGRVFQPVPFLLQAAASQASSPP